MRFTLTVIMAALTVAFALPASAELQNVIVGGELRIRGNWYSSEATISPVRGGVNGPLAPATVLFDERGNSNTFVESRAAVNVRADFTNDVSAFIELDSYELFGENFRDSAFLGAANQRDAGAFDVVGGASPDNDVDVYQAYIETRETWGFPLTLRAGRQEMMFGSEWLVGNNSTAAGFTGLSFDGISATYDAEMFSVTGFATQLAERGPVEEDGDQNFYGVYASYTGLEDVVIDAYWFFLREGAEAIKVTPVGVFNIDFLERLFNVDQFDETTNVHTFGLRGAGNISNFDFEAEVAYQTGDAATPVAGNAITGFAGFFNPDPATAFVSPGGNFGEDDAEYDHFGANVEVGYTFDVQYNPRVYLGGAFFEGENERDDTLRDFLRSLLPFRETEASLAFNRLFSDWEYSEFLSNTDLSNAWVLRGGFSVEPTESLELLVAVSYFQADEETTTNGLFGIPGFGGPLAVFGRTHDDELGWELGMYLTYHYSEDLSVEVGWAHFFADDGARDGNLIANNGTALVGGVPKYIFGIPVLPGRGDEEDADYVFVETSIAF